MVVLLCDKEAPVCNKKGNRKKMCSKKQTQNTCSHEEAAATNNGIQTKLGAMFERQHGLPRREVVVLVVVVIVLVVVPLLLLLP